MTELVHMYAATGLHRAHEFQQVLVGRCRSQYVAFAILRAAADFLHCRLPPDLLQVFLDPSAAASQAIQSQWGAWLAGGAEEPLPRRFWVNKWMQRIISKPDPPTGNPL